MDDNRYDEVNERYRSEEEQELLDMSVFDKLIGTITSPTKAMKALKLKPTFWLPLIVIIVMPLLYYVIFWQSYEVQLIRMMESQSQTMGMELTRDMMEMQLNIAKWTTPLGTLVIPVTLLVPSLIYFLIGKIIKAETSFKGTFAMVSHASVITAFVWILHMVVTLIMGESDIFVPMSSAVSLLPADSYGTVTYGILSSIDVFGIWYYIVLFLGLNIVCGYSKRAAGITVAITVIASMGLAVGGMLMAGLGGM